ncbi:hypothetical protein BKA57DRAFT_460323 [Linnemannia elongata]|nr:hypothetical protein BKA57DRAFT_460323 [Linnemannia elongata]
MASLFLSHIHLYNHSFVCAHTLNYILIYIHWPEHFFPLCKKHLSSSNSCTLIFLLPYSTTLFLSVLLNA